MNLNKIAEMHKNTKENDEFISMDFEFAKVRIHLTRRGFSEISDGKSVQVRPFTRVADGFDGDLDEIIFMENEIEVFCLVDITDESQVKEMEEFINEQSSRAV